MGESQFEKLLKTLKAAERDRDLSRHTVDVQDKIINELRDDYLRLRDLLKEVVGGSYWDDQHTLVPHELFDKIEKEVGDDR